MVIKDKLFFKRKLIDSEFYRNVAVLMSGTALAQGMYVLAAPILSRLFQPDAFGILALYNALVVIVTSIASLRYEISIVLPRSDDDAVNLLSLSLGLIILNSILLLIIIAFGSHLIVAALGNPALEPWLWFVPLSMLAVGVHGALYNWSTRHKQFMRLSITDILRALVLLVAQIVGGLLGLGVYALIWGNILGQVTAVLVLSCVTYVKEKRLFLKSFSFQKVKQLAKKYQNFPKYNSPQVFISILTRNLTPFLLACFFGSEVVGLYSLTERCLQTPIYLISQSVMRVFYQKASEIYNHKGNIYGLLKRTTLGLVVIGFFPALTTILAGPQIFSWLLGDNWYTAGSYARWLIIWLFFNFINPPAVSVSQVLGLQRLALIMESIQSLLCLIVLVFGGLYLNDLSTIALYSLIGAAINLSTICIFFFISRRESVLISRGV